jgi:hypothetical protein
MMTRMRRVLLIAMAACGRSDAAPTQMTSTTFEARSDADLGTPVLTALAAAEKAKANTFSVHLAAGSYQQLALESDALAITVEAQGEAVFSGSVSIKGRAVTLRGISIANARPAASALVVAASDTAELSYVTIVGTQSSSSEGDPLVDLVARKKGATAKIDHLAIVDSQAGALVRVPANGPGRWASVALRDVVFAANRGKVGLAIAGLDPAGTGLAIDGAFVAEPNLTDAWLRLDTARPVTVSHAVLAIKPAASEGDGKVAVSDNETVKLPAKLDPRPFVDAVKAGTTDRTKLRALLK